MRPKTYPIDRSDSRITAARAAERDAYHHYGLEPNEHVVDVDDLGLRMRVVTAGSGPPVVLLPGGHGPGSIWIPLLAELVGYSAYIMDRPGGGLSDGIDYRSVPLRYQAAASTLALFDFFDLAEAPVVGNSMGGLWVLRFALKHPERVSAIVLPGCPALYPGTSAPFPMRLGSVPGLGRLIVENMMQSNDAGDARGVLEVMGHPRSTVDKLPQSFAETWYRMENTPQFTKTWVGLLRTALTLGGADPEAAFSYDDLRSVRLPVTLIWGSDDPFGTVSTGRTGAAYFPDASFHEVGVGHLPWLDEPESCGEIIREGIRRRS